MVLGGVYGGKGSAGSIGLKQQAGRTFVLQQYGPEYGPLTLGVLMYLNYPLIKPYNPIDPGNRQGPVPEAHGQNVRLTQLAGASGRVGKWMPIIIPI